METLCHRYDCEVAFADTDASGWVHFSKILIYAERAEHDFLNKIGLSVFDAAKGGWPRVRVSCDYKKPLRFQELFQVHLCLKKLGSSSITWSFEILKSEGELAAIGEMIVAKVDEKGVPCIISNEERRLLGECTL